ncbi:MAG: hypothetical protein GYA24_02050 [Candidatus Lokiarchaeota archaeon]|nr:hypothetical protein [Candidatus Lokiarchaeota archaeon]
MLMRRCSRTGTDYIHSVLVDVIERQIEEGNPKEALLALDRLIAAGCTQRTAIEKMAAVLFEEIHEALSRGCDYDAARYAGRLRSIS